jgi:hypothetical protein
VYALDYLYFTCSTLLVALASVTVILSSELVAKSATIIGHGHQSQPHRRCQHCHASVTESGHCHLSQSSITHQLRSLLTIKSLTYCHRLPDTVIRDGNWSLTNGQRSLSSGYQVRFISHGHWSRSQTQRHSRSSITFKFICRNLHRSSVIGHQLSVTIIGPCLWPQSSVRFGRGYRSQSSVIAILYINQPLLLVSANCGVCHSL